jgi:hypothetical protein
MKISAKQLLPFWSEGGIDHEGNLQMKRGWTTEQAMSRETGTSFTR